MIYSDQVKQQYQALYDSMVPSLSVDAEVIAITEKIQQFQDRYLSVSDQFGIMPFYFVGMIHYMEASFNFTRHIANGDPLSARTVHVPIGLPVAGNPPFTWEDACTAEFGYFGFKEWSDWSIPGMLYLLERWNGFSYRQHGINTPYLWSKSNLYTKGKYVADGVFDPEAVSQQIGAAIILKNIVS